jgi:hypothetical protein
MPEAFRSMASSVRSFDTDGDAAAAATEARRTEHSTGGNGTNFFQQTARHYQQLAITIERQHEADLQLAQEQAAQEIRRLRQELAQQQAKIDAHEAQLRSFANLARGPYTDEEDSNVADDVRILHQKLISWASLNCLPHMDAVRQAVNEAPAHLARRFAEAGVDDGRLLDPTRPVALTRLPARILAALVVDDIYAVMFCKPFFFLSCVRPYSQCDRPEALFDILALLRKGQSPPTPLLHYVKELPLG